MQLLYFPFIFIITDVAINIIINVVIFEGRKPKIHTRREDRRKQN